LGAGVYNSGYSSSLAVLGLGVCVGVEEYFTLYSLALLVSVVMKKDINRVAVTMIIDAIMLRVFAFMISSLLKILAQPFGN
jgi:hypothetical protein